MQDLEDFVLDSSEAKKSFADRLLPTNFDARNVRLWKIEGEPGILVRENKIQEGKTLAELGESLAEGEVQFIEMRTRYGIHVVSMKSRKEKNRAGKETFFTLVDNVEGENLFEIEHLPIEASDELEALYISLAQHYYDAWKQKLKYWGDARSDQFVYGSKYGEKERRFYLTDIDPEFYREGDDKWHTIEAALGSVCHDLVENEGKFTPNVRLQAARDKLLSIIE